MRQLEEYFRDRDMKNFNRDDNQLFRLKEIASILKSLKLDEGQIITNGVEI